MDFKTILQMMGLKVDIMRALPLLKYVDKKPGTFSKEDVSTLIDLIGLEVSFGEELLCALKHYLETGKVSECADFIQSTEALSDVADILINGLKGKFRFSKPIIKIIEEDDRLLY